LCKRLLLSIHCTISWISLCTFWPPHSFSLIAWLTMLCTGAAVHLMIHRLLLQTAIKRHHFCCHHWSCYWWLVIKSAQIKGMQWPFTFPFHCPFLPHSGDRKQQNKEKEECVRLCSQLHPALAVSAFCSDPLVLGILLPAIKCTTIATVYAWTCFLTFDFCICRLCISRSAGQGSDFQEQERQLTFVTLNWGMLWSSYWAQT
jgi:hypothetical protein